MPRWCPPNWTTVAAARDLRMPLSGHLREARVRTVTGAFDLKLRIALITGVALSGPLWLYELFAFVAPGLNRKEKRYSFGFLAAALPLFVAGCAAGLLLFPHMVEVLASFASTEDSTLLAASYYFDFVMKIVLATGMAFTLPVFIVMLNFLGIVSASALARSWRVCVIAIIVVSALVTPAADVLSMFLIALPMTALFFGAYLVAVLHRQEPRDMFGLSFEKILVIAIIAAFVLGPRRLPLYAGKLADLVRDLRAFVESTRARAEDDLGVPLSSSEWMDLRRYDPRRIVRDALEDEPIDSGAAHPQQGSPHRRRRTRSCRRQTSRAGVRRHDMGHARPNAQS